MDLSLVKKKYSRRFIGRLKLGIVLCQEIYAV